MKPIDRRRHFTRSTFQSCLSLPSSVRCRCGTGKSPSTCASKGCQTIGPYQLEQTRKICLALGVKRELRNTKFLVYQDDPGEGFQASIFKRFYWWEDECSERLAEKFGVTIVKKSFRELGAAAKAIPDALADETWQKKRLPTPGLSPHAVRSAIKLYLAVSNDLDADPTIGAAGINCLNESHFCDTTPCLAWNLLYEERGLIWGCEADTMSMITKFLLHKSLEAPIMMTNLYPFLLGNAALKHERIESFPPVPAEPENHVLVAHCGYMGVIPTSFATEWALRPKGARHRGRQRFGHRCSASRGQRDAWRNCIPTWTTCRWRKVN